MSEKPLKDGSSSPYDTYLRGTTYRVYRFMLKQREPVGISQLQEALRLSSPSVSEYHIKKLLRLGLVREEQAGYVVDKVVFDNIIRLRRVSIPIQTAYVAFFGVTLFFLLAFLRPTTVSALYFFAVAINVAALGISSYETRKTLRHL